MESRSGGIQPYHKGQKTFSANRIKHHGIRRHRHARLARPQRSLRCSSAPAVRQGKRQCAKRKTRMGSSVCGIRPHRQLSRLDEISGPVGHAFQERSVQTPLKSFVLCTGKEISFSDYLLLLYPSRTACSMAASSSSSRKSK